MVARIANRHVLSTRESPVIVPKPAKSLPITAVKKSEAALAIRPKHLHAYAPFSPAWDHLFLPCLGSKNIMSTSPEADFDLEKLFLPAWAKESPQHNRFAKFEGEPERRDVLMCFAALAREDKISHAGKNAA